MNVRKTVKTLIMQVAEDQGIALDSVKGHQAIVDDLGFSSLDVATLAALFEAAFHVDPFAENMAAITEIRTVNDVVKLYERCIASRE